jgi:Domain of unknown function (DUF4190)
MAFPEDGGGSPPYPGDFSATPQPSGTPGTNTTAVASLVCSIIGFAPYVGGVLSIVGIVLGAVALNQIKETPQGGYGVAVAGIAVGVATLIIGLIWTIFAMR